MPLLKFEIRGDPVYELTEIVCNYTIIKLQEVKITTETIQLLKSAKNSAYNDIKKEFLFHSNKLEGSTFTKENLEYYLNERKITGTHDEDDVCETINSTKLFDFVVDTLNEPLLKRLILEFHRMLKDNTSDHIKGFAGCWKKIPNRIAGVDMKVADPWEVDELIGVLLDVWDSSMKTIDDIIHFHVQFEKIHPFQDGNGRVGRFIILKQCIENNIDLISIDETYSKEYKYALRKAQTENEFEEIQNVFQKCQVLCEEKLEFAKESIDYIENNQITQGQQML